MSLPGFFKLASGPTEVSRNHPIITPGEVRNPTWRDRPIDLSLVADRRTAATPTQNRSGFCGVLPGQGHQKAPLTSINVAVPVGFDLLFDPGDLATAVKVPSVLGGLGHSSAHLGPARSRAVVGFLWGLGRPDTVCDVLGCQAPSRVT